MGLKDKEFKFRRNVDIGNLEAENDKFLMIAFVEKEDYKLLKDISNPRSIVLGRTGSGKSALITHLENSEENVKRIQPEILSLRHLSNSNIISYFNSLGIKLDLFYKFLWKHVFIVELIKLHFKDNEQKSFQILEWLKKRFDNNKKRKIALDYLEEWETKFWEDTEYRIKEIEASLEKRFITELGTNIPLYENYKLSGKLADETKEFEKVKIEITYKAQKVVNELQIEKIQEIIKILQEELFNNGQKKYYVLVDDLDRNWVDTSIVYDLIKSLIEVIKEFMQLKQVKIIIALRTNINQVIFKLNKERGFQREKYNQLYLELLWNEEELKELVNNRLREMMKGQYTNTAPTISDILPIATKRGISGFDYILKRTLMRPRDVIDFLNKCNKYSDGKTKIHWNIIRKAEDEYSHERLRAINDEWQENHGNIFVLYEFIKKTKPKFTIDEIYDKANLYFLDVIANDKIKELNQEWQKEFENFGENFNSFPLLKKILITLYEIGLLGLKIDSDLSKEFVYETYSLYKEEDILNDKTLFYVHPMFYRALRINIRKEGEQDYNEDEDN